MPRDRWEHPEGRRLTSSSWDQRFGDRAQKLVFIGQNVDEADLRAP